MTMTNTPVRGGATSVVRNPQPSGLYDVLSLILDKGLVIDAYVRVSLVGIELLTIDARVVIASVDTYLRFAEAVDRLNIRDQSNEETTNMGEIVDGAKGGAKGMAAKGTIDKAIDAFSSDSDEGDEGGGVLSKVKDAVVGSDDDDEEEDDDGGDEGESGGRRKQPARAKSGSGQRRRPKQRRQSGDDDGDGDE
jgi:gas vesicle structural protein